MKNNRKVKWIYLIVFIILLIVSAIIFGMNSYISEEESSSSAIKWTFMYNYSYFAVRQEPYIIGLQIGLYVVLSMLRIILVSSVNIKNNIYKSIYAIILIIVGCILVKNPPMFIEVFHHEQNDYYLLSEVVSAVFEEILDKIYSIIIIFEGVIVLIASNVLTLKNRQKMKKEESE